MYTPVASAAEPPGQHPTSCAPRLPARATGLSKASERFSERPGTCKSGTQLRQFSSGLLSEQAFSLPLATHCCLWQPYPCHCLVRVRLQSAASEPPAHPGKAIYSLQLNPEFRRSKCSRCVSVLWKGSHSHHTRHPRPVHKAKLIIRPRFCYGKSNLEIRNPSFVGCSVTGRFLTINAKAAPSGAAWQNGQSKAS